MGKRPTIELVPPADKPTTSEPVSITKPEGFDLTRFKSKRPPSIAGVATLLTALPHHKLSDANDFGRLHPDEVSCWSPELCFVTVPIKGQKRDLIHLIDEDLATAHLSAKKIERYRLALASKPYDVFFLCHVPTQNLDNAYNRTNLEGCELAKARWVQLTSRKPEGVDEYKIDFARDLDAFPEPQWPKQALNELIGVTFAGQTIIGENDPALLRLIGAKPIV